MPAPDHANSLAPGFSLQNHEGNWVSFSTPTGKKTWVAFFRYPSCPLCNLRIHEMRQRWPKWHEAGLEILAIFQSDLPTMRQYVARQEPEFPLLCDPDEATYGPYGLGAAWSAMLSPAVMVKMGRAMSLGYKPGKTHGTKNRIPGDFLIGADGRIADLFHGRDIGEHIPFERVEAFIRV